MQTSTQNTFTIPETAAKVKYNIANTTIHLNLAEIHKNRSIAETTKLVWEVCASSFKNRLSKHIQELPTNTLNVIVALSPPIYRGLAKNNELEILSADLTSFIQSDCHSIFQSANKNTDTIVNCIEDNSLDNQQMAIVFGSVYFAQPNESEILKLNYKALVTRKNKTDKTNNNSDEDLYLRLYQKNLVLDESSLPINDVCPELVCAGHPIIFDNPKPTDKKLSQHTITITSEHISVQFIAESNIIKLQLNNKPLGHIVITPLAKDLTLNINQVAYTLKAKCNAPSVIRLHELFNYGKTTPTDIIKLADSIRTNDARKKEPILGDGIINDIKGCDIKNKQQTTNYNVHSLWLPKLSMDEKIELFFDREAQLVGREKALIKFVLASSGINIFYRHAESKQNNWQAINNISLLNATFQRLNIPLKTINPIGILKAKYHMAICFQENISFSLNDDAIIGRDSIPYLLTKKYAENVLKIKKNEQIDIHPATAYLFSREQIKIQLNHEKNSYKITQINNKLTTYIIDNPVNVIEISKQKQTIDIVAEKIIICGLIGFKIARKSINPNKVAAL